MPDFNTLADFPADQFGITAYCDACGHSVRLDIGNMPQDMPIPDLRRRLRCSGCGNAETRITISYHASVDLQVYGQRA